MSILTLCKYCKTTIEFDESVVGLSGRMIPLDLETQLPHECPSTPIKERERKTKKCRSCGKEIFFDSGMRNPANGKCIPQDIWGSHRCKGTRIVKF
jgi:hypothetical protein